MPLFLGFHDDGSYVHQPPGAGGSGPFNGHNMKFLSNLTIAEIGGGGGNVNVNDCWGWTDSATGKEYAIMGLTNRASFIDISNPLQPEFLGFVRATGNSNSTWRDMKVFNDHVFIVADNAGNHGMQVFDLTRLRNANPNNPQDFSLDGFYSAGSFHNIAINEDSGFAYLVGGDVANGGLHVVNINNPTNPTFESNFGTNGYTHDCQVVIYNGPDTDYVGQEIAFCSNGPLSSDIPDTLAIVNATNKNNLTTISSEEYPSSSYSHQCWVTEDHRFLFHGDEIDEINFGGPTRTIVWDIQDLDNPIYLGFYQGTTDAIDHNAYVKGNCLYLANYKAGTRVIEFDPANVTPGTMTEIASLDTFGSDNGGGFEGAWSCYPFFDSGVIVTSDISGGMFLSRLTAVGIDFFEPSVLDPSGGDTLDITVTDAIGSHVAGTVNLHVDRGNGFEVFPATQLTATTYEVDFPPTTCGTTVNYYVSVETTFQNQIETEPACAPNAFNSVLSADGQLVSFNDNSENNLGWTFTGNASDGGWSRGVPEGGGDRGDPANDADGSGRCYLTDNEDGNSDVDNGSVTLTSPILDGSEPGAILSYYRWFVNDGNDEVDDEFVVEISNNGGNTWINLETVGVNDPEASGGWFLQNFVISDVIAPTANMRIRFIAEDVGEGSIVEAGVDGIRIEAVECNAEPAVVPPATVTVFRGIQTGGAGSDLADSDDVFTSYNPGFTLNSIEAPVWIIFDANLPFESPSSLMLEYESQANTPGLTATFEAFNWVSNSYDVVDTSSESFNSDSIVSVDLSANAPDYVVAGTADVRARLGWRQTGFTLLFPWEARIDRVIWTAE